MFNFIELAIFGTPFDSTSKAHFIEPSKSRQGQNEAIKLIPKMLPEFAQLAVNEINVMIERSCKDHKIFGQKTFEGNHPSTLFKPMYDALAEHFKVIFKKFPSTQDGIKAKLKYLQFFDTHYHREFEDYRATNQARYKTLWFDRDLFVFYKKQTDLCFGTEATSIDLYEFAKSKLPDHIYRYFLSITKYITHDMSIKQTDIYTTCLFYIFHCLNNKTDINDALKTAWIVAYTIGRPEAFPLALYPFQQQVISANLPYLNVSGLLKFYEIMMKENDENYSIFEEEVLFRNVFMSLDTIRESKFGKAKTFIEMCTACMNPETFQPRDVFIKEITKNLSIFRECLKTTIKLSPLEVFSASPADYLTLYNDIQVSLINIAHDAFNQYDEEAKSTTDEIEKIQENAKLLAVDPLGNLEQLIDLKSHQTTLQQKLDEIQKSYQHQFDTLANKHNAIIDGFNKLHSMDGHYDEHEHKIDELTGILHDANLEIEQLKEDKKRLNELLNKPSNGVSMPVKKPDCMPVVLSFLEEKNPFVTIVKTAAQRDWVVLSSKLIKSLEEIKTFSRPLEFAKAFDILTSKDFVEAVSQKGSEVAFSFFTKTQVAFKESESTMMNATLKNQRFFQFSIDGKQVKLLCEPHLRIGNNNTAQEQLRIHFVIQNGIIHIGYIGRHLPTGAI